MSFSRKSNVLKTKGLGDFIGRWFYVMGKFIFFNNGGCDMKIRRIVGL